MTRKETKIWTEINKAPLDEVWTIFEKFGLSNTEANKMYESLIKKKNIMRMHN